MDTVITISTMIALDMTRFVSLLLLLRFCYSSLSRTLSSCVTCSLTVRKCYYTLLHITADNFFFSSPLYGGLRRSIVWFVFFLFCWKCEVYAYCFAHSTLIWRWNVWLNREIQVDGKTKSKNEWYMNAINFSFHFWFGVLIFNSWKTSKVQR